MTFDLILLAVIVIFLFLRLKNQFGKIDESDEERKKIIETFKKHQQQNNGECCSGSKIASNIKMSNIEQFKRKKTNKPKKEKIKEVDIFKEEKKSSLGKTLDKIFEKCGNANEKAFLYGSETAFEMVVSALSNKDFDTLRVLLSKNIFEEFKKEIEKMDKKGQRMSATVVSITKKEILSAKIVGKFAYIDVFFESEQIIFIEEKNGKIISGSKDDIKTISEIWTFRKNVNDENPNWLITGTRAK